MLLVVIQYTVVFKALLVLTVITSRNALASPSSTHYLNSIFL